MVRMRVRVLFFGRLREMVGRAEEEAELDEGARVEDLFARYGRAFPALGRLRPSVVASVNQEFSQWSAPLRPGDEVAFLPPVSGGEERLETATAAEDVCELVRRPIRTEEIVAGLKAPEDGAVVVFDGIVRHESAGRRTLFLEYEAYEPMALRKMREIGAELKKKFPVHRVVIVHRLGRLEIGETSVLIAVSAPHRHAAFDACRFAIDTLKRTVPIWKKEHFADGAVWVEGEMPSRESNSGPAESTS
jgi:MoaE-MoaD fusion protein